MAIAPPATGIASAPPAGKTPVRVMVVDDSVVIRGLVGRWVDEDPDLEVVAKCANGKIAVDSVATARPDVIVLDIEMPVMDGLAALPKLLEAEPRPHILVASTLTKRNAAITLQALSRGASECLPKPDTNSAITTSAEFRRELVAKIRGLGGLDPVTGLRRPRPAPAAGPRAAETEFATVPFQTGAPSVLAIGSSTGGPKALSTVLADARAGLARVPVLVTQHMPPTFTAMLAENLARTCGVPAKEAEEGEVALPGHVYVAPGGRHLVVRRNGATVVMGLDDRPPVNFTKPSVDVMLNSIVDVYRGGVLAIILTGMGQDGAQGVGAVRAAGGNIIAQDQATSVVWGMPGAAAHTGLCSAVLPVQSIGAKVAHLLAGGRA